MQQMRPLVSVSAPQSIHLVRVYNKLSRLTNKQLEEASVIQRDTPDTSNPGGYSHRYVYFSYRSMIGLWRTILLYCEESAIDESQQQKVANYAQRFITNARGLASAKSFKW